MNINQLVHSKDGKRYLPIIKFSVVNNKIIVNVKDNNINLIDAKIILHRMLDLKNYNIKFYDMNDDFFIIN